MIELLEMDTELELQKLAEECGELVQACMKNVIWGYDNFSPKHGVYNVDLLIEEMGDVLCHIKRTVNAIGIDWDQVEERARVKAVKVNKYHYGVN